MQIMYGTRTAEAIGASTTVNQVQLADRLATGVAEFGGIFASGILYSWGRVEGTDIMENVLHAQ